MVEVTEYSIRKRVLERLDSELAAGIVSDYELVYLYLLYDLSRWGRSPLARRAAEEAVAFASATAAVAGVARKDLKDIANPLHEYTLLVPRAAAAAEAAEGREEAETKPGGLFGWLKRRFKK